VRNCGLARTFPFTHRAIEVAMLISCRILCSWIDYCDVEKTDSNTAACCEVVVIIKITCGLVDYCEVWDRTAMCCLWLVKEFTKCTS